MMVALSLLEAGIADKMRVVLGAEFKVAVEEASKVRTTE